METSRKTNKMADGFSSSDDDTNLKKRFYCFYYFCEEIVDVDVFQALICWEVFGILAMGPCMCILMRSIWVETVAIMTGPGIVLDDFLGQAFPSVPCTVCC